MTKKRTKTASKITITFLIGMSIFLQIKTQAYQINTETLIKGIDFIDNTTLERDGFNNMIRHFCSSIPEQISIKNNNIYNKNESLFLFYLCKNEITTSRKGEIAGTNPTSSYVKYATGQNLLEKNLPSLYHNTENFIQKLFDSLISSYTSIYQASIYGYGSHNNMEIKEIIEKNIGNRYFGFGTGDFIDIEICPGDKNISYPRTCKRLQEYVYGARNLINNNTENYLNDENIYKSFLANPNCSNNEIRQRNIIACGVYGGDFGHFINTLYNELIFYSLFVEYYSYILANKPNFRTGNQSDINKKLAANQNRIEQMYKNLEVSREGIQLTIKTLKEIQYAFPVHIGFLMYSEDIYKFTNAFNKTLTPLYTLYDIFRNVQNPD